MNFFRLNCFAAAFKLILNWGSENWMKKIGLVFPYVWQENFYFYEETLDNVHMSKIVSWCWSSILLCYKIGSHSPFKSRKFWIFSFCCWLIVFYIVFWLSLWLIKIDLSENFYSQYYHFFVLVKETTFVLLFRNRCNKLPWTFEVNLVIWFEILQIF